ncbi:hypothetical protein [Mycolicibacterium helvum]|uniref:Uncharacterized protein n=1 Tax=Mycolicibacterium helvum TaxID=1534349 RepID=A0A7I7T0Z5_9MYCO|nr:hypothetical protein [Mycolicibacterium helvum]BBY62191.1 hypothetical protein MHEL_04340 [Mycolicibacterium helvum]
MTSQRQLYLAAKRLQREHEAAQIGKVETTTSGVEFVRPLGGAATEHVGVPNRVDRWRRENPGVTHQWPAKATHGYVTQMWDARIYRGECVDCGDLVTACRFIGGIYHRRGQTNVGRWPKYCDGCRDIRKQKHNDGARSRMRRVRERQYEDRNSELLADGCDTPPRQGVAATADGQPIPLGGETPSERRQREAGEAKVREIRERDAAWAREDKEAASRFQQRRGVRSPFDRF